jgi:hypothetical protein
VIGRRRSLCGGSGVRSGRRKALFRRGCDYFILGIFFYPILFGCRLLWGAVY